MSSTITPRLHEQKELSVSLSLRLRELGLNAESLNFFLARVIGRWGFCLIICDFLLITYKEFVRVGNPPPACFSSFCPHKSCLFESVF